MVWGGFSPVKIEIPGYADRHPSHQSESFGFQRTSICQFEVFKSKKAEGGYDTMQ